MGGGEGKKLHIQFSRGLSFFCNIFLSDTFGLPSSCYHLPLHHWIDFRESSSDLLSRCCGPGAASCLEGRPPAHILHAGMTAGQRQGENMNRFGPVVQGLREKYPLFLCVSCASLRESSQNLRFQSHVSLGEEASRVTWPAPRPSHQLRTRLGQMPRAATYVGRFVRRACCNWMASH